MSYLCELLIAYIIYLMYKTYKIKKGIKMSLQDFQTQIDSINTSLASAKTLVTDLNTQVANLNTELGNSLSGTDAATVLAAITSIATELSALVAPATPAV